MIGTLQWRVEIWTHTQGKKAIEGKQKLEDGAAIETKKCQQDPGG